MALGLCAALSPAALTAVCLQSALQGGSGPAACCSAPAAGLPAMRSAGGVCAQRDGQGTTAPKVSASGAA